MNRKNQLIIKKTASLKNIILLGLLFLIMAFFIMPEASNQIKRYSQNTGLIDGMIYYSPGQIYQMMTAYSEKGRKHYIAVELTADLFFSVVIAAFLSALMIRSALKSQNHFIEIKYLLWLPIVSMLANWLENAGIIWMLIWFPKKHFYLALLTSFFTLSKWVLMLICLVIVGWNLARIALLKFKFRQKPQKTR